MYIYMYIYIYIYIYVCLTMFHNLYIYFKYVCNFASFVLLYLHF